MAAFKKMLNVLQVQKAYNTIVFSNWSFNHPIIVIKIVKL